MPLDDKNRRFYFKKKLTTLGQKLLFHADLMHWKTFTSFRFFPCFPTRSKWIWNNFFCTRNVYLPWDMQHLFANGPLNCPLPIKRNWTWNYRAFLMTNRVNSNVQWRSREGMVTYIWIVGTWSFKLQSHLQRSHAWSFQGERSIRINLLALIYKDVPDLRLLPIISVVNAVTNWGSSPQHPMRDAQLPGYKGNGYWLWLEVQQQVSIKKWLDFSDNKEMLKKRFLIREHDVGRGSPLT